MGRETEVGLLGFLRKEHSGEKRGVHYQRGRVDEEAERSELRACRHVRVREVAQGATLLLGSGTAKIK